MRSVSASPCSSILSPSRGSCRARFTGDSAGPACWNHGIFSYRALRLLDVRSPRASTRLRGFTLVEVLVVVVVIAILASLVGPNIFQHVATARETTARSQIEMLGAALDIYRLHVGRYPTSEEGLAALWEKPASVPSSWRGPYLRKSVPLDPWGNPYLYVSPGAAGTSGYELHSLGRDGREGGEGEDADVSG